MKIVGFGDSFITSSVPEYGYTKLIAKHYNAEFETYAHEGSGAWDAYFQLTNYLNNNTAPDVVLCVWSVSHRLYHSEIRTLCYSSVVLNDNTPEKSPLRPIVDAAKEYYTHLFDLEKADTEHSMLYYWIDKELPKKYPNTKFIHMWGFPKKHCDYDKPEEFEYLHHFTNSIEIRPALIHLSYMDQWPKDLSKETRINHLTPIMHRILASAIINAIENYNPGILNIKL